MDQAKMRERSLEERVARLERALSRYRALGAVVLCAVLISSQASDDEQPLRGRELVIGTDKGTVRIGEENGSMALAFADATGRRLVDLYASPSRGASMFFRRPGQEPGNLVELWATPERCNLTLYKESGPAVSLTTLTCPSGADATGRTDSSSVDVWDDHGHVAASLTSSVNGNGWLTLRSDKAMFPLGPLGPRAAEVNGSPTSIEEGAEQLRRRILEDWAAPADVAVDSSEDK